jgi:hypothetical protein
MGSQKVEGCALTSSQQYDRTNTMLSLTIFLAMIASAMARVTHCGGTLQVTNLEIDPPGIVAANQSVRARFDVIVPDTLNIEDSNLTITTSLFGLTASTYTTPLCDFIGCPVHRGSIGVERTSTFPDLVFGHVSSRFLLAAANGTELLCVDWTAYATGSATNETNWAIRRMYA